MAYNKENLIKLGHLEALGRRVKEQLADVAGPSLATDAEVAEMLESVFDGTGTEGRNE